MMTQERKDELLKDALRLFGTHLDEDENIVRALGRHLGMTADEMAECGVIAIESPEQNVRARFEQKVKDCFENYKAEWLQKRPDVLIEEAEEIASVQRMAKELPSSVTDEDAEYLLRFKNPLEVVSDAWREMNGSGTVVDDDMTHILWDIQDKRDAEQLYELEPEYRKPTPSIQTPELTM